MKLIELTNSLKDKEILNQFIDHEIISIEYDSRKCSNGSLFVAVRGSKMNGNDFIAAAIKKGAVAIIGEAIKNIDLTGSPVIIEVPDSRKALAQLSHRFYGNPSNLMDVTGITGTNGKTTLTFLLKSIFNHAGKNSGIIGTTGIYYNDIYKEVINTTPESKDLAMALTEMKYDGISNVFMEVSSHALDQGRAECINFSSAIFTNLTHDHLDYHSDFESYSKAKSKLFRLLNSNGIAIVNGDDIYHKQMLDNALTPNKYRIGRMLNNDFIISDELLQPTGAEFKLIHGNENYQFRINISGRFNIDNSAMAATLALLNGLSYDSIKEGLELTKGAPGRMELINLRNGAIAFVDYAHTPDALEKALLTCREMLGKSGGSGKLISVFGCGGDRDKSKRPIMGSISSSIADITVITSDNPRLEEPDKIIGDIYSGISNRQKTKTVCITNRNEAIGVAFQLSHIGDIILVAGKGHEKYQIIGTRKLFFDDSEELRRFAE